MSSSKNYTDMVNYAITETIAQVQAMGLVPTNVNDDTTATGISLISSESIQPSNIKLKELVASTGITINQVGTGNLEIENSAITSIGDAAGITGQSLISSLSSGYDTYLKSIKSGAGVSVSTVGQDIVISGAGAIYNPVNEIYIDASYSGSQAGTSSEPFNNLDSAITHLGTLPNGNYVFIFNQGNYSTLTPWSYPMSDGVSGKALSMLGKVANGCVISSDINFLAISGVQANFQVNSIALVGTTCTMDLSAHVSGEFNSISFINGFINNLVYTGPPLGNPSLVGYVRSGVGQLECVFNGPTIQNAFLIGNINLTSANSRVFINSCSNVNCLLTLTNGSIANISGLVSTLNPNWLVSGDADLNLFYLDAWTGALSTLTGDLTLAKVVIDKELIAGTNITLVQNPQGQTTISASGGSSSYTPPSLIYLDNQYTGLTEDGGIFTPFKTLTGAFTYIGTLTTPGQYKLIINSSDTPYTGGSLTWPIGDIQLSAVGTSGLCQISEDITFNATGTPTSVTVEISNIVFTGANNYSVSGISCPYNVTFNNCNFVGGIGSLTNSTELGKILFNNCNIFQFNITGTGKLYLSNCDITSDITVDQATLKTNNCRFDLAARIVLAQAGSVYLYDLEHLNTSATNFLFSSDATANRAYIDDASYASLPTGPALAGGTGLGTTFLISGIVSSSLSAGSGVTLTTNPSTGKTQIAASFSYTPYIDDLGDAYHDFGTDAIALGFKPTTGDVSNANIFISNNEPTGMDNTSASNFVLGNNSLTQLTTNSSHNIAIGKEIIQVGASGLTHNVCVGNYAGQDILDNSANNVCIGGNSGFQGGGSGGTVNCTIVGDSSYGNKGVQGQVVLGASIQGCGIPYSLTMVDNLANQAGAGQKVLTTSTSTGQIGGIPDGTAGQVLTTNGSGSLSFTTVSGGSSNITGLTDAYHSGANLALGFKPTTPANYVGGNIYLSNTEPASITTTALTNIAIGNNNLTSLLTGDNNLSLGQGTCSALTSGIANIALGYNSLNTATNANSNVIVGSESGQAITNGTQNIILGGSSNVDLGSRAQAIVLGHGLTSPAIDTSLTTYPTLANQAGTGQKILTLSSVTGQVGGIPDALVSGNVLSSNAAGTLSWIAPPGATTITTLNDAYKGGTTMTLGFKDNLSPMNQSVWLYPFSKPGTITTATANIVISGSSSTMGNLTSGQANVVISPTAAMSNSLSATNNVVIGTGAGLSNQSNASVFIGTSAGNNAVAHNSSIFIGTLSSSGAGDSGGTGSIVIGANASMGATGHANQIVIGQAVTGCNLANSLTTLSNLATQAGAGQRVLSLSAVSGQVGPIADGTAGQVLTTNGSGSLSWSTPGGGGGSTLVAWGYGSGSPIVSISDGSSSNVSTTWSVSNLGGKWTTGASDHITVQSGGAGVYEIRSSFTYRTSTQTTAAGSVLSRFILNGGTVTPNYLREYTDTFSNNVKSGSITNTWIVSLSVGDVVRGNVYNDGLGVNLEIWGWNMTVKFLY